MTPLRRFEQDLPALLADLYLAGTPDYRDDLVRQVDRVKQRPAWMFPERWLPMVGIARQPVLTPRIPWRSISLAVLLIALLLAAAAVLVGSQPRLPAPFGVAANGLIAYDAGGDIYAADPSTGAAMAIVSGPETDVAPYYSRDGSKIVFARQVGDLRGQLYVVGIDGSGLTLVTPEPVAFTVSVLGERWPAYEFAPDGRSVLFASTKDGHPNLSIAQSDGSGVRQVDVGIGVYEPSFRPPDGDEILFVGPDGDAVQGSGIFAVDVASGLVRTVIPPQRGFDVAGAVWSPDGSQIAYQRWGGPAGFTGITAHTHVVSADGTGDRTLPAPQDAVWDATPEWSNDGERLFIIRGYTPGYEDVRPVVIPADGSGIGIEIPYPGRINGECCAGWEWSPDDSRILLTPSDELGRPAQQVIVDPLTGTVRPAPWSSTSDPTWQRRAP